VCKLVWLQVVAWSKEIAGSDNIGNDVWGSLGIPANGNVYFFLPDPSRRVRMLWDLVSASRAIGELGPHVISVAVLQSGVRQLWKARLDCSLFLDPIMPCKARLDRSSFSILPVHRQ